MDLTEASRLARQLMNEHGLNQVPFAWSRGKRIAGNCHWSRSRLDRQICYCKKISISVYYVQMNDESHIRNTILHEIAHALVGHGHGHDYAWRRMAISIGCTGERCYGKEVNMPKGRYKATCNCGKDFYKHRLGANMRSGRLRCRRCKGKLIFVDTVTRSQVTRSPVFSSQFAARAS